MSNSNATSSSSSSNHNKQTLIDEISGNLLAGDLTTKIHAAREIRTLIRHRNSSDKIRDKFAAAGVIPPLVLMLCSKNDVAREVSVLALLNLASRNERNKEQIVTCGAIPPLVELLKFQNGSNLRELATATVLTLSTAPTNKQTIVDSGVVPLLVEILSCGSVQGRVDAVTALYNLTTTKQEPIVAPDAKSIPPLINLLKECKKSSKFAEKTTALIEIILKSESEEGRSIIANAEDGILTLVETIEDGSYVSSEHAVSALLALCLSSRSKFRQLILNEGAIPGLLRLGAYGTYNAQEKARTLLDLLRDSPAKTADTAKHLLQDIAEKGL